MNEKDLKDLLAEVAADRLQKALENDPGNDDYDSEAFDEGITAVKAYTEMVKVDDAHNEELGRQELEKDKQESDKKFKMSESTKEKIIKGVELGLVVVVAPIIGYKCNKNLAQFLCKAEQFESFTSTAGRSLGKMFKF